MSNYFVFEIRDGKIVSGEPEPRLVKGARLANGWHWTAEGDGYGPYPDEALCRMGMDHIIHRLELEDAADSLLQSTKSGRVRRFLGQVYALELPLPPGCEQYFIPNVIMIGDEPEAAA
jgi:hypothetical protein